MVYNVLLRGGEFLLERYKENIKVSLKKEDTKKERNDKRKEAVETHFNEIKVDKNKFINHIKSKDIHKGQDEILNKVNELDFSNANPRNKTFMNELAFAGESIVEGFLDVFNIERNKAVDKYMDQLQVIERKEEDKPSQYFIGSFNKEKLFRVSPYKDNKEILENKLAEKIEQENKLKQEQVNIKTKENSLTRRKEE